MKNIFFLTLQASEKLTFYDAFDPFIIGHTQHKSGKRFAKSL